VCLSMVGWGCVAGCGSFSTCTRKSAGRHAACPFPWARRALCSVRGMLCFRQWDFLKGISLTARWNARCNVHGAGQDQIAILQQWKRQVSSCISHMVQGMVTWVSEGLGTSGGRPMDGQSNTLTADRQGFFVVTKQFSGEVGAV
jgi:hypothetical protein